jgi:chemotaxis protein methyltransferase CheR
VTPTSSDIGLSDGEFTKLCAIVYKHTGITIGDGRKSLLLSRLRGRLRDIEVADFRSYIARLADDKVELQEFIDRMTTNKTYCYRTPRIWEHFRHECVTDFLPRSPVRPLRVWSAASSTGEEACTAGVLLEDVRQKEQGFDYAIQGTDISSSVLKSAEAGSFAERMVAPLRQDQPELFARFMVRNDAGEFSPCPAIRTRSKFKLHNLVEPLKSSTPFDAVFLRNVLIYFTPEDQERILDNVAGVMTRDSVLYIGESETLSRLKTAFEMIQPMVYRLGPLAAGA